MIIGFHGGGGVQGKWLLTFPQDAQPLQCIKIVTENCPPSGNGQAIVTPPPTPSYKAIPLYTPRNYPQNFNLSPRIFSLPPEIYPPELFTSQNLFLHPPRNL